MLAISNKYPSKRAFITGTASGLGEALSLLLAKDGWTIGMCDINEKGLVEIAEKVKQQGGQAITYLLDTSNRQQFEQVAQNFLREVGGIDLLINNAGVGDGAFFHQYSLEDWDWMIGINQMGVIYGCYFFVPRFQEQQKGHIINISSVASFSNGPGMSAYSLTKAAVRSLSETLYYELAPFNVNVSVVMPSFFKTNIMKNGRGSESRVLSSAKKLVENAQFDAHTIALEILKKAAQEKLNIILPKEGRRMFWLSRIFPSIYRKQILKIAYKLHKRTSSKKQAEKVN